MRIGQECGQKWYRKSSWRHRPWFRKLEVKVIQKAKVDEISETEAGISVRATIQEYKMVHVGWAFGPIMLHK